MSKRAKRPHRPPRAAPSSSSSSSSSENLVVGRHAVEAALVERPDIAQRLYALESAKGIDELIELARQAGVGVEKQSRQSLDERTGGVMHQGAVLTIRGFPYAALDDVLLEARGDEAALSLVLDGVEDPRNLGAAARAAYAFGARSVVIPKDRAASCTAAAHKAAAGALFRLHVVRADNLRRALDEMKEAGFWIYGAEADGELLPWEAQLGGRVALVVGGEDRGVRRLTREACDGVLAIPMASSDVSLNAADAATVLLYEVLRQRRIAGG